MRISGKLAAARIWTAIGMVFIALFVAAPASTAVPPASHVDHHVTATGALDHFATVGHEHIAPAAIPGAPEALSDALAPRMRTVLLALGLIFAVALLVGMLLRQRILVGRDPPRGHIPVTPGQDVLARLCISRR